MAASAQPGNSGCLVLLVDEATNDRFQVDTGAVFSVIPFTSSDPPTGPRITTANALPIPCWGWTDRGLNAGGAFYRWKFLKAKVAFPVLGVDCLSSFDLLLDLLHRCLIWRQEPAISLVWSLLPVAVHRANVESFQQWWWSQCHSWRCCRWWSQQSSQRWSQ